MANKNLAILLKEGRLDQIQTEIDPDNREYYGIPGHTLGAGRKRTRISPAPERNARKN